MNKTFDCVEMKRKIQQRIHADIKDMTPEQQVAYFRQGAEQFWKEMKQRRMSRRPRRTRGPV